MLFGGLLDGGIAAPLRNHFQSPLDVGPFGQHCFPSEATDVVEVEIDGEASRLSKTQIDRRATLENEGP
jgi:hypothetical protein